MVSPRPFPPLCYLVYLLASGWRSISCDLAFSVNLARFLAMCIGSSGNDAGTQRSKAIDKLIRADEKRLAREVKLLLLGMPLCSSKLQNSQCFWLCNTGAGESGKSTILKQMKLIHASGFSKSERDYYRGIIFSNLLTSLKVILEAMEGYDIKFENKDNEVLQEAQL